MTTKKSDSDPNFSAERISEIGIPVVPAAQPSSVLNYDATEVVRMYEETVAAALHPLVKAALTDACIQGTHIERNAIAEMAEQAAASRRAVADAERSCSQYEREREHRAVADAFEVFAAKIRARGSR